MNAISGYGEIQLFAGSGCQELANKIAEYIGVPLSPWEIIEFPNDNIWVRLNVSVRGQDVYLIQSHCKPVHRNIMESLIAMDCFKRDSALVAWSPLVSRARRRGTCTFSRADR